MSSFSELFARFPGKLMELLVDECCYERRPVYLFEADENISCPCDWCENEALYIFKGYDDDHFEPPLPNLTREGTCGEAACEVAHEWFWRDRRGANRRRQFMQRYGERCWLEDKALRLEKALALILECESRKAA